MNGWVDQAFRALANISLRRSDDVCPVEVTAWVDIGFTGELILPQNLIDASGLAQSGVVWAELADGSSVIMPTYTCLITWFGKEQQIEVMAKQKGHALLGVGLLRNHKLTVDYRAGTVMIE